MPKAINWIFTINNYTDEDITTCNNLVDTQDDVQFLCYGKEIGESGTPHLQGYLELSRRMSLRQMSRILPRAYLHKRNGTQQQAIAYTEKDGEWKSFGTKRSNARGESVPEHQIVSRLIEGHTIREIIEEFPREYIRFSTGIERAALRLVMPHIRSGLEVHVYWGETGTGKTRKVYNDHPITDVWSYTDGGWFDGYDGQPIALFDDFSGSEFRINVLLRILDIYPFLAPIKHGRAWFLPDIIYLTSNIDPRCWYPNAHEEHRRALRRRFTSVTHFSDCIFRAISNE